MYLLILLFGCVFNVRLQINKFSLYIFFTYNFKVKKPYYFNKSLNVFILSSQNKS